jgi:hypothetical protein
MAKGARVSPFFQTITPGDGEAALGARRRWRASQEGNPAPRSRPFPKRPAAGKIALHPLEGKKILPGSAAFTDVIIKIC